MSESLIDEFYSKAKIETLDEKHESFYENLNRLDLSSKK